MSKSASTIESTAPDGRKRVLSARGVTKVYRMGEVDVHALRGVDWDLHEGEMTVLVDEIDDENGVAVARSMADAPEIDGNVFIEGEGATAVKVGEFVKVRITDADEYDLYAERLA